MLRLFLLSASLVLFSSATAEEQTIEQKIAELEKRIAAIEASLQGSDEVEEPWKYQETWQSIKKGMPEADVKKLLGEPSRIVDRIFTTWYYHPKSELHAFVWFDEGEVLGWEPPEGERPKVPSFLNRQ